MQCLYCNEHDLQILETTLESEYRDDVFDITVPAYTCTICGFTLMDTEQMNHYRKVTKAEYDQRRGL